MSLPFIGSVRYISLSFLQFLQYVPLTFTLQDVCQSQRILKTEDSHHFVFSDNLILYEKADKMYGLPYIKKRLMVNPFCTVKRQSTNINGFIMSQKTIKQKDCMLSEAMHNTIFLQFFIKDRPIYT